MEEEESEQQRVARVKELEDMVKKLEKENKQLLHRVKTTTATTSVSASATHSRQRTTREPEEEVINLGDVDQGGEDDWLFVSPRLPPTPTQRRIPLRQWLSEGHAAAREQELPSLDDVRRSLTFHMTEAENLSNRAQSGAESPPLKTRQPRNRTAQKYLDQVRVRRRSSPTDHLEEEVATYLQTPEEDRTLDDVPVVKARPVEDDVPRVSWKPQAVAAEDDVPRVSWKPQAVAAEDDVPRVSWKPQAVAAEDDVPVVRWKPSAPSSNEDIPRVNWKAKGEGIPKVNWKPETNTRVEESIPKVSWKPPAAANSASEEDVPQIKWKQPAQDNVPKVNWKPPAENDVPKIKWKAPSSAAEDDIPVVGWKSQGSPMTLRQGPKVRNVPIKPIVTHSRRSDLLQQNDSSEDNLSQESYGAGEVGVLNGGDSDSQISLEEEHVHRHSRYTAHYSGLQRPSNGSPSLQYRNVSPRGRLPRPAKNASPVRGSPNRSPSPLLQYSPQLPGTVRSRSPSPSVRYGGQVGQSSALLRHSPQTTRKQILPPRASPKQRSPSPTLRMQPQGLQAQAKHSPSGSPSLGGKMPSPGASPRGTPASAGARHPSGLPHPPSSSSRTKQSGLRAPQSPSSLSDTPPSSRPTPRRSGLTPPGRQPQQARGKRVLPTPPSNKGSGSTTAGGQGTPPRRTVANPPPQADDDDSWLKGCF